MRKKLIEVALPLEAINAASSREKSIRHGHPSTLHLWWARRPLAACRAILFGQLVDDPSSCREEFRTEEAQEKERQRLFRIIEELVKWENSTNERVIYAARREIARSVARARDEQPPVPPARDPFEELSAKDRAAIDRYLAEKAPPVLDPFCGGGSIPLEAQRLGLRAYASDLNPVAVLITKALIEIPPKFAGQPPVNPEARAKFGNGAQWSGKGAEGLAEDVRYYGRWMRDEAEKRIGHLYPKAKLPDGNDATVIAWLWARTVASPNPAAKGAHVPLVSSFVLSSKKGKEAIVLPIVDAASNTYRFKIKTSGIRAAELAEAKRGTKTGRGAHFSCLVSGAPVPGDHIKAEGQAGRMGMRLMAVVAEGARGRMYLAPTPEHEEVARRADPAWKPEQELADDPRNIWCVQYGLRTFAELFIPRQLVALTTFSDLVNEARKQALADARAAGTLPEDDRSLNDDGAGPQAYSEAVATYLAFALDKCCDYWNTIATWAQSGEFIRNCFARQAIPMTWDFAEGNPFSDATANWLAATEWVARTLAAIVSKVDGGAKQLDAVTAVNGVKHPLLCTDPPYYDNIGYADLSDFFYVWLRRSTGQLYPELFSTLLTPKTGELVATPYRFGGDRLKARRFFETGLGKATAHMRALHVPDYPMSVIYAYKQAETETDDEGNGVTASTGWETMLTAILGSGFSITGTWPVRSERGARSTAMNTNALASSIVLACRPRPDDAPVVARRDFAAALRRELPDAVRCLQQENIAPVDLAQAAIGPGMAVFSRYAQVLEADGKPMPVRAALVEINRVLDEVLAEQEGEMDSDTRFCVAWYETHGFRERPFGEAEVLFTAKATSFDGLQRAGVIVGGKGKVRLRRRDELGPGWDPATDSRLTDWECTQYLVRALTAEHGGGIGEAGRLAAAMGPSRAENARALAYRLYTVAERKGWAEEAFAYNILVTSWPQIQAEAQKRQSGNPAQAELAL